MQKRPPMWKFTHDDVL